MTSIFMFVPVCANTKISQNPHNYDMATQNSRSTVRHARLCEACAEICAGCADLLSRSGTSKHAGESRKTYLFVPMCQLFKIKSKVKNRRINIYIGSTPKSRHIGTKCLRFVTLPAFLFVPERWHKIGLCRHKSDPRCANTIDTEWRRVSGLYCFRIVLSVPAAPTTPCVSV